MTTLPPFQTLYDLPHPNTLPLPPELAAIYGPLTFPHPAAKPHIIANFVTTLDGVTSLEIPGQSGGGPISGNNPHDHLLMGLLRATADAIIVGAGTLPLNPHHLWRPPAYICPRPSPPPTNPSAPPSTNPTPHSPSSSPPAETSIPPSPVSNPMKSPSSSSPPPAGARHPQNPRTPSRHPNRRSPRHR